MLMVILTKLILKTMNLVLATLMVHIKIVTNYKISFMVTTVMIPQKKFKLPITLPVLKANQALIILKKKLMPLKKAIQHMVKQLMIGRANLSINSLSILKITFFTITQIKNHFQTTELLARPLLAKPTI